MRSALCDSLQTRPGTIGTVERLLTPEFCPVNMTESSEKESQRQELQRSPSTLSIQQVSKLQRLKRSLSFKTIMRSKSVENFFQRSNSDARLPQDFFTDSPSPSPPLLPGSPLSNGASPSLSPSFTPNTSLSYQSQSLNPPVAAKFPNHAQSHLTHCFQEYVFRQPTYCQLCNHMIVGNSKQGLRCKACKIGAHLWCSSELSQQPCNGKSGVFKRNFSSPLLVSDTLRVTKEGQATRGSPVVTDSSKTQVDPVYETLRYGTSLAQINRSSFGSVSESPTCSLDEGGEDGEESQMPVEDDSILETAANSPQESSPSKSDKAELEDEADLKAQPPKRIEVHSIHTYVALYKFLPQEENDLELQPGDRVQVIDDSNEEWWKGKSGDKVGFFPANFVQRVRPGERVWRVTQGLHGSKEMGHMTVKEYQICVGKNEDNNGFLKLSSGKKRGLVPCNSLEEI